MTEKDDGGPASIRAQIFAKISKYIEDAPSNGIAADGTRSEALQLEQIAYIRGLQAGRLAAIRVIDDAMLKARKGE